MLVSIIQNGRKKQRENSFQKITQFFKLTDKSNFSSPSIKVPGAELFRVDNRRDSTLQKQNLYPSRTPSKTKNTVPYLNILTNRPNIFGTITSNIQDSDLTKKTLFKAIQEQSYSIMKSRKSKQYVSIQKLKQQTQREREDSKTAYFFRILLKKNKLRTQFNLNIHNSIYTFKEFIRACDFAPPKAIDRRIPIQLQDRKTIVFDMDQTLIHTNQVPTPNYQIKVPFRSFQGRVGFGFVQIRPHCREILKRLSQYFDIIIFTASTQAYADPIIDYIDPGKVIIHRLYRQSCSFIKNQVFVKDLRVLGRNLQNVVLVDNAPYSYLMQLQNAIPIISYYRGREDEQLLYLQKYLMKLKNVDDVRTINRQYFKLHEYMKFDTYERLINKLYGEWIK